MSIIIHGESTSGPPKNDHTSDNDDDLTMQYYDVALEHLSTIDLESFRSILPEHVQPFVLLSYPIRAERTVGGNSSTLRYSQREEVGGQNVHGVAGVVQRVYKDGHGHGYGNDAGSSSGTASFGRKVVPSGSGSDSDCQPRPPYHSYHQHHAASHSSASSASGPSTSYLPLCEPLTIPHPSTHPYNLFYDKGPNDALFVIFWAVFFTILREALMRWAYRPFIRWHLSRLDARERERDARDRARPIPNSISSVREDKQTGSGVSMRGTEERLSKKEQKLRDRVVVRFAEQAWTCTYATVFWSLGFVSRAFAERKRCRVYFAREKADQMGCLVHAVAVYPASRTDQPVFISLPLAQLPAHAVEPSDQVLLPGPARILVPPALRLQPRSQAKGLLSDVDASFRHDRPGHGKLLGELHEGGDGHPRLDGLLRYLVARECAMSAGAWGVKIAYKS